MVLLNPLSTRRSGILLHPTSLPSGQLDDDVFRWLDFLHAAGQRLWQVLPLGMPSIGYSPYQCLSAFAANPALLPDDGNPAMDIEDADYQQWLLDEQFWINDFALYLCIKRLHHGINWFEWSNESRHRETAALESIEQSHSEELNQIRWQQFQIHRRWKTIHQAAAERDIAIFGDIPIFVAHDSADVWAGPQRFLMDDDGKLTTVTGVPPDYFSETGQRWGNPHYDWDALEKEDFRWWMERLEAQFRWFDLVRIDHFRGLESVWMIEPDCETAVEGHWEKTPGDAMLTTLKEKLGELPLVAEDLGIITPEVVELRKRFALPGMSVLQFGFDAFDDNPHKPKNITNDTVVYTGTHDNDTTQGWFDSLEDEVKNHVMTTLGIDNPELIVNTLMNTAMQTEASLCVLPLQDVLGLDSNARMNIPGDTGDHWRWRFDWQQLNVDTAMMLKEMTQNAGRI